MFKLVCIKPNNGRHVYANTYTLSTRGEAIRAFNIESAIDGSIVVLFAADGIILMKHVFCEKIAKVS